MRPAGFYQRNGRAIPAGVLGKVYDRRGALADSETGHVVGRNGQLRL